VDNRWDRLHGTHFVLGASCSASVLCLKAREAIGLNGHELVKNYDMASIGLGGFDSNIGWLELHNVGSDKISLRMFNIKGSGNKVSDKGTEGSDEFKEVTKLGEFKLASRVAKEAQPFVPPWKKSLAALKGFMHQTKF
jgi:hypothetical protein